MEQNKTRTYFIYALSEILLVVAGILIALQLNNWNLDRIQEKQESELLESVIESLKEDSLFFTKIQDELDQIDQLHQNLYLYVQEDLPADSINNLSYLRHTLLFNPLTITNHPDLVNQVISPKLKQTVRSYFQKMDDTYYRIDSFNIHLEEKLIPYLAEIELFNYSYPFASNDAEEMIHYDLLLEELEDTYLQQMLFDTALNYQEGQRILAELQDSNDHMIQTIHLYLKD